VEKPARTGGKFAYLTLSDPSGEFELMVPPEVLSASRDDMEVGAQILCKVKVRRFDDELRFSMESVKPLNRAALGKHDALRVRLSQTASLENVAHIAEGLKKVRSTMTGAIILEIPIDNQRLVTVALDGRYPVDLGAMAAFKSLPGVDQVRPAAA